MVDETKSHRLRFGEFSVDLTAGELFKRGTKIPVQEKPFEILSLLLQRPKEVLSRNEIIRAAWPDTFVEGNLCLNVAMRRLRLALNDDCSHPHFIETIGRRGYRFIASVSGAPAPESSIPDHARPRVAIFPLKAYMGSESGSFAPALTELLITALRQRDPPFLVVTPEFTTERGHKGRGTLSLCRQAAVDYVLVGAVAESSDQVRVNVRLLDCHAQACIWANTYTNPYSQPFAVQEEISQKIVNSIIHSVPISPPIQVPMAPPRAYECYVRGCEFLSKMTDASIRRSIPVLQQALRECPKFALGWAALANAHCAFARLGIVPPRKTFPKAKAAADRAIQLQDVAQARTARAFYHFLYEHDWNAAEADLVRALAIDPGYSMAMGAYAQLLFALGRNEDAVAMMRRACELDPVSINARTMLGWVLYYTNRYHEALVQLEHAMELDPSAWIAEATKGLALLQLGRLEQAIPGLRSATERSAGSALAKAYLACGLAKARDRPGAEEILQVLLKLRERRYFSSYWIAAIHACMDNHSVALEWLKTAVEERCGWMVFAGADPHFAILRNDPWFRQTAGLLTLRRAS